MPKTKKGVPARAAKAQRRGSLPSHLTVQHLKGCPKKREAQPRYDGDGEVVAEGGPVDALETEILTGPAPQRLRYVRTRCMVCGEQTTKRIGRADPDEEEDDDGDEETESSEASS